MEEVTGVPPTTENPISKNIFYKVQYFHGEKWVEPKLMVSFSNTELKSCFSKRVKVNEGRGFGWRPIPLEDMIKSSLKANGIDANDREAVENYAVGLINDFALTLESLLLKKNYLFNFPFRKYAYIFLSQMSTKSHFYRYDTKNKCSFDSKIYIKHRFETLRPRAYCSKKVTEHFVGLKKKSKIRIRTAVLKGRRFLPFESYIKYIYDTLPYGAFLKNSRN